MSTPGPSLEQQGREQELVERVVRSFGVPNALRLSIGDGAEVAL